MIWYKRWYARHAARADITPPRSIFLRCRHIMRRAPCHIFTPRFSLLYAFFAEDIWWYYFHIRYFLLLYILCYHIIPYAKIFIIICHWYAICCRRGRWWLLYFDIIIIFFMTLLLCHFPPPPPARRGEMSFRRRHMIFSDTYERAYILLLPLFAAICRQRCLSKDDMMMPYDMLFFFSYMSPYERRDAAAFLCAMPYFPCLYIYALLPPRGKKIRHFHMRDAAFHYIYYAIIICLLHADTLLFFFARVILLRLRKIESDIYFSCPFSSAKASAAMIWYFRYYILYIYDICATPRFASYIFSSFLYCFYIAILFLIKRYWRYASFDIFYFSAPPLLII